MRNTKPKSPGRPRNKQASGQALSDELRNRLERFRFPKGFVCPFCKWHHSPEWARSKVQRIRNGYRGPRPGLSPASLKQTWYLKNGKIKCQNCKRHVSLTVGTVLEGIRTPLNTVLKTVGIFLKSRDGVGTLRLAAQAGISPVCARNLIGKFHAAMPLAPDERLEGKVQIDEFALRLRPARSKHAVPVAIAIAVEDMAGKPGRIAAASVHKDSSDSWTAYLDMVKPKSSIQTRLPASRFEGLCANDYRVGQIPKPGDPAAPQPCATVFARLEEAFRRTYRGAITPENLPGYLDEFAFRWNHLPKEPGADPLPATHALMRRLLQPPIARLSHDAEVARYESDMARV